MKIFIITFFVLIMGCHPTHQSAYRKQMKDTFIYDFKITYFKKLLLSGYNNSNEIKSLMEGEQSGFGEIILSIDDYNLLDSIVNLDNAAMVKDSLNGNRRAEGTQGKRVLGYALDRYNSKWLDNLARARYDIYKKSKKDTDL